MTGTRIWALGTAIIIIAVLALGYLLGVSPMMTRLAAAEQELASTQANNQVQQTTLQVMKTQFEDLDSLKDDLEVLRISIPGAVDSDFVYALLAGYQQGTGALVSAITTGEAQPYGVTAEGEPTAEGSTAIPNLYTVPITITFTDTPLPAVLAYVASLQRGPRLFLVTGLASGEGENGASTSTVTAFMFVLADPNADPADAANALVEHPWDVSQVSVPLGPAPSASPTPDPSESATPTPTPSATGTPAP